MREIDNDSHLGVVKSGTLDPHSDRLPPSPITGHSLTKADNAKGGRVTAQRARERREKARMSFEEILRQEWEAEAREYARTMIRLGKANGDVPTFKAITDRLYGTPTHRQEIEDVTDREVATDEQLEELRALEAELKRRKSA